MEKTEYKNILDICSRQDSVREDVFKNHDDNMWWPLKVTDYRKRLLIAGLSTRISYNMIRSYQKVIDNLDSFNYDEIKSLRIEAKQKLNQIRPASIGQASRISGVSPADVSVLLVYLGSR